MDDSTLSRFPDRAFEYVVRPFAIAGFFVLVAFLWTLVFQHIVPYPFLFLFLGAVMGSAWFGGRFAGLISVILSTATVDFFFVPPLYSFTINPVAQTYCIAFIVCAVVMSWVSATRKRTEDAIREARDLLEQRVLERTEELRNSIAEIQESERRLRSLTEAIPQQIWRADIEGNIEHCNQHLLEYTGCSTEDLLGANFFSLFHPDDQENFQETWQQSLSTGHKLEGEWRVRGKDGDYRWFLVRGLPQRGPGGAVERWYGTHIDTEERRRAEQALAEAHAELSNLSQRLSMGEMAASIAHELNQPLTAVATNAYACREWLNTTPPNLERACSTADKIVKESKRASDVVRRVRALFSKELDSRSSANLNRLIQDLVRLTHDDAIRRNVSVHMELAPALPSVIIDAVQIQQVLLNLAINGMDAMTSQQSRRELTIRTTHTLTHVQVEVQDCGPGIDPAIAPRIFDAFFTTKPQGIGMGLAICRSVIEAHDGRIWMQPASPQGTSFCFTIPVHP